VHAVFDQTDRDWEFVVVDDASDDPAALAFLRDLSERYPRRVHVIFEPSNGGARDWETIFHGYRATVDWPAAAFWRELVERYPDAKVLLSLRDADAVATAAADLLASARPDDGAVELLVAPMVRGNRELIAGVVRDPQFGPCVMLGIGGVFAEAIADVQQGAHGERNAGERPAERHLTDLDATADLHLLLRRQQRNLADFLEVQAHGVLALRGKGRERLLGNGPDLVRLVFGKHGLLGLLLGGAEGGGRDELGGVHAAFLCGRLSKCHGVTGQSVYLYDAFCPWNVSVMSTLGSRNTPPRPVFC